VSSARASLNDERFDASWGEGRALGFDRALEHARRTLHSTEVTEML
jgi:hypothetical protein